MTIKRILLKEILPKDCYPISAFSLFAFVASVTPGPANLAIFSQAAKYAWLKTIPFAVGITVDLAWFCAQRLISIYRVQTLMATSCYFRKSSGRYICYADAIRL